MDSNQIYIILSLVHDKELLSYFDLDLIFKVIAGFHLQQHLAMMSVIWVHTQSKKSKKGLYYVTTCT